MIAWIGVVAALSFFVLWGGGVLNDLGRRPAGDPAGDQPALKPPAPPAPPEHEEKRLRVFEDFIRSLPDDEGGGPPSAAG